MSVGIISPFSFDIFLRALSFSSCSASDVLFRLKHDFSQMVSICHLDLQSRRPQLAVEAIVVVLSILGPLSS